MQRSCLRGVDNKFKNKSTLEKYSQNARQILKIIYVPRNDIASFHFSRSTLYMSVVAMSTGNKREKEQKHEQYFYSPR
jgi:hypothetical protein